MGSGRKETTKENTTRSRQVDPEPAGEEEDLEIFFKNTPGEPGELDYGVVLDMVQQINSKLGLLNLDNDKIRSICDGLLRDYQERDRAFGDLTKLVHETMKLTKLVGREYGPSRSPSTSTGCCYTAPYHPAGPHR